MGDKFIMGVALGMLGGALIVASSVKARKLVKQGQDCVKQRIDKMGEQCEENKEQQ